MNALANLTLVLLFVLALSGMLWVAWMRTKTSPRLICCFFAFALMALVDVALIVTQTPPAP